MMMRTAAKYFVFALIGALIVEAGFPPSGWQWWAWFIPLLIAVHARDWAMRETA